MLSSCVDSEKDLYDPSYQTANPMGDGFAAPDGFDWNMTCLLYTSMVARLQSVISEEIKKQLMEKEGRDHPDYLIACVCLLYTSFGKLLSDSLQKTVL